MAGRYGGGGGASYLGAPLNPEDLARSPVFSDQGAIYADDIQPGDVVRRVRGSVTQMDNPRVQDAVILDVRDEYFDYILIPTAHFKGEEISNGFTGSLETAPLGFWGLAPINDDRLGTYWSSNSHVISLGLRVSPTPLTFQQAERMRVVIQNADELAELHSVEIDKTTLIDRVLRSFIDQATDWGGHTGIGYQEDLREV